MKGEGVREQGSLVSYCYSLPSCSCDTLIVDHYTHTTHILPCLCLYSYVDSLPMDQEPEAFGLHANADISKDLAATDQVLAALIATGE